MSRADPVKARRARWDFEEESPLRDARGFDMSRQVADPSQLTDEDMGLANVILTNGARLYVDDAHALDLAGRTARVLYFGHSSGPGDIAVFDETSGTLFAGGLLDARRVPDIQDSDLPGWRRAL